MHDLAILDTPPELAYDDLAALASVCCQSEIAAVNFVDDKRHWTKAIIGVEGGQGSSVSGELSFCAATVATDSGLLNLDDTAGSETWKAHPFVAGPPFVRFYAGAAIVVSGQPIGVVCVYGDEPRELSDQQKQALIALAGQASGQLELRQRNADLRDVAVRDPLTGLANRTLLFDHLEMAIAQRRRDGRNVGLLFLDIDDFKQVNDRWGHEVGDQVLCRIADRLRPAARDVDTVARFAGDEFVLLCPDLDSPEDFDAVIQRIDRVLHEPNRPYDGPVSPRLSIGRALLEDEETAADLLSRADEEMYKVKAVRPSVLARD